MMMRRRARTIALISGLLSALGVAVLGACGGPATDSRIGIVEPDRSQFDPVGKLLEHRCGSIDCHGSAQRNLQIWGCEGMRLDPTDSGLVPKCRASGGKDTTETEFDATFRSLVALEPAVMTTVVEGKGSHPELLTFVRKARGDEAHKGGALWKPGDAQDTCVTSWLAGSTDTTSCSNGIADPPP